MTVKQCPTLITSNFRAIFSKIPGKMREFWKIQSVTKLLNGLMMEVNLEVKKKKVIILAMILFILAISLQVIFEIRRYLAKYWMQHILSVTKFSLLLNDAIFVEYSIQGANLLYKKNA